MTQTIQDLLLKAYPEALNKERKGDDKMKDEQFADLCELVALQRAWYFHGFSGRPPGSISYLRARLHMSGVQRMQKGTPDYTKACEDYLNSAIRKYKDCQTSYTPEELNRWSTLHTLGIPARLKDLLKEIERRKDERDAAAPVNLKNDDPRIYKVEIHIPPCPVCFGQQYARDLTTYGDTAILVCRTCGWESYPPIVTVESGKEAPQ